MVEIRTAQEFSFFDLLDIAWEMARSTFLEVVREVLETMDQAILETRDQQRYEVKQFCDRGFEVGLGYLQFARRQYWDREKQDWAYLLDETLQIPEGQRVSDWLRAKAVEAAADARSYRAAADEIQRQFGYRALSHESIRQYTLQVGETLAKQMARPQAEKERRQAKLVFVETDGFWPGMQQRRKREVRVAVTYEGWEKRSPGSEAQTLVHRQDMVIPWGQDVWEQVRDQLELEYDLSETWVVINGDRAVWIRQGVGYFPRAIYQVDRFHLVRDLKRALRKQTEYEAEAQEAVQAGDADRVLRVLALAEKGAKEAKERDAIRKLRRDLTTMPEAICDYRVQLRARGVSTEELRGMGVAESAVARYSARLRQGGGRSWSPDGLMAMAHVLVAKFRGTLRLAVRHTERLSGLEEALREAPVRARQRVVDTVSERLDWARHGHMPALDLGRNASGGLSRTFRRLIYSAAS